MKYLQALTLIALMLTQTACVTMMTQTDQLRMGIQYGVMRVADDAAGANEVLRVAGVLRSYVDASDEVSVTDLAALARDEISWGSMHPADVMLAEQTLKSIVANVQTELNARIKAGKISPDRKVEALALIGWIEQAAYRLGATR